MLNNNPSLEDFDNDAALGGRPATTRPRRRPVTDDSIGGVNRRQSPRQRPTPDSTGPKNQPRRTSKPKQKESYNIVSFFTDIRTHLAAGTFLCLTSIIMLVCTISYIFNSNADQSIIHGKTPDEILQSGEAVANAGGVLGAKLAEYLLVNTFGIASFVLVCYIFLLGIACMHLKKINFFSLTFKSLFATISLSVIFGLFSMNSDGIYHLGGNHGHYINELIYTYADALGLVAVSVLLCSLLIAVFLHPLRRFCSLLYSVMPKPKFSKKVAEADETDDEPEEQPKNEAMEALETDRHEIEFVPQIAVAEDSDDLTNDEIPQAGETDEEAAADIPEDHRRFVPAPALDDFEQKATEEESSAAASEVPDAEPAHSTTKDEVPAEPEMVIMNPVDETEEPEAEAAAPIRHGDHIGLDTPYDVRASHSNYQFPPTDLLREGVKTIEINEEEQAANKALIVNALRSYNIEITRIEATIGPTVTLYEIVPSQGTRIAKIKALEDDIAMSLSALGIRIIAPIPGKGTIGIEVPNSRPQIVSMRTVLESPRFKDNNMHLPMALGKTISNQIFMADLAKMPHLLVAGATGQGKSVGLNCIIASLLYSKHPDELKFVLIDPKMVEFSLFQTIDRQYLAKLPDEENAVITEPSKALETLNSLCVEMEQRYELLKMARVKSLEEYNERFTERVLSPELGHRFLPYIVMIVDEYADLVMTAGKDISQPICRIAQKARAVGMHMIIATQRPSTDVITGMIKANFPARIAFKVTQGVDSKTILDRSGAQRLIGRGDMLTLINGKTERVQCALIETAEVEAICQFIGSQSGFTGCYQLPEPPSEDGGDVSSAEITVTDEFRRCAMFIASQNQASITMMQRNFEIGFNKAGRFMDQMQKLGIVGPANGAKPRQVLMSPDAVERLLS
ncbi:MAG: DNA translocase FtsK [Muribaculaceae bacterium]|nr:DNA translocase FtsK [Muribaculaceae bacterium]